MKTKTSFTILFAALCYLPTSLLAEISDEDGEKDVSESTLFPDWSPPEFNWNIDPIVAFKYSTNDVNVEGKRQETSSVFEAGLWGSVWGIPVIPGNAGYYIEPQAGYVWGTLRTDSYVEDSNTLKTKSIAYTRYNMNLDNLFFWRFYRHTLGIGYGQIDYDDEDEVRYPTVESAQLKNDFGFLILPWVSAHYTHRYVNVYTVDFATPFLVEQDNWIHARIFTNFLSFYIDIGPGFTLSDAYLATEEVHEQIASGRSDYVLMLTGMHLFWKIGMNGEARYVYASTEEKLGSYAQTRLPSEGLYDPRTVSMPEDSLRASAFLGAHDLFFGLGLGYYYNLEILNMSGENEPTKTTKENGFGVSYQAFF